MEDTSRAVAAFREASRSLLVCRGDVAEMEAANVAVSRAAADTQRRRRKPRETGGDGYAAFQETTLGAASVE